MQLWARLHCYELLNTCFEIHVTDYILHLFRANAFQNTIKHLIFWVAVHFNGSKREEALRQWWTGWPPAHHWFTTDAFIAYLLTNQLTSNNIVWQQKLIIFNGHHLSGLIVLCLNCIEISINFISLLFVLKKMKINHSILRNRLP